MAFITVLAHELVDYFNVFNISYEMFTMFKGKLDGILESLKHLFSLTFYVFVYDA
jgi:hypothetical protein